MILNTRRKSDKPPAKKKRKSKKMESTVRVRRNPKLNEEATSLQNLIYWEEDIHEPVLTLKLSDEDLMKFYSVPMVVPDLPLHTQSNERCVKEVTRAAKTVFGYERRNDFI